SVNVAPGATIAVQFNVDTNNNNPDIVGGQNNWQCTGWALGPNSANVDHANHDSVGSYSETFNITAPIAPGTYDLVLTAYAWDNFLGVPVCHTGGETLTLVGAVIVEPPDVQDYISQLNDHNGPTSIPDGICAAGDFNFVVDTSGSVDSGERTQIVNAITSFVNTYEAGGDGRYSLTVFSDNTSGDAAPVTSGFETAGDFLPLAALAGGGRTPTSTGISTGLANNAGDRGGVGNIMFIITDGSPNLPGGNIADIATWIGAANAAIGQANTARGSYHVVAVYVGTPDGSLETAFENEGFSPGDADTAAAAFAVAVMNQLGGGSHQPAAFASLAQTLLDSAGCEPPEVNLTLVKSDANGAVPGNFDLEIRSWPADALIQSGTGTGTTAGVAPDNDYHIVELVEPGWVLAGVQCQDSQQNNVPLLPNNDANSRVVQIPANVAGDVTCTFTNRPWKAWVNVTKIVTNVVNDTTPFDFSFSNPATAFTLVNQQNSADRPIAQGDQVVTEAPEPGYTTLGWARIHAGTACPAAMPTSVSGNVISFGTDNTYEVNVPYNNTYVVCFYNEREGFTITAEKVVCDAETDLPNWAGSGAVDHDRVEQFVNDSNGRCAFDPKWIFEVHPTAGVDERPDDNIEDAPNFTNFTGSITLPLTQGNHRIREQKPAGYVDFTGVGGSNVSAEFYCGDDVANYDNLEWVGGGDTYCVGFNAHKPITIKGWKVVCTDEGQLPEWSDGTAGNITSSTAQSWVNSHDSCEFQDNWAFEYRIGGSDPGDNLGDLGDWTNFDTVTSGGAAQVPAMATVDVSNLGGQTIWAREIWDNQYIPFTGTTGSPSGPEFSAEFYCTADVKNFDNRERIENTDGKSDVTPGTEYHCVGWNVPAKGDIHNVKVVTNDGTDTTQFSANVSGPTAYVASPFTQTTAHVMEADPGEYTSVEQDPGDGYVYLGTLVGSWDGQEYTCPDIIEPEPERDLQIATLFVVDPEPGKGTLKPGGDLVFCHYNERLGQVFLTKYENIGGADTWDFDADELGDPSYAMPSNTTGITISHTESWWLSEGNYSVSELNPGGICEEIPGAVTGDFETLVKVANAPIGANEVTDLGSSTNYSVTPGGKTYIAFGNRDCSEVLSAANIIVRKWQDVDADFSGESLLSGWTITITGTGGAAAGFGPVSQDTAAGVAAFLGVPDGTYTIQETPKVTHTVVGSDWRVGGLPNGSNTSGGATLAGVSVALDQTLNVDFFNQPKGKITVVKVETDNVGGGNFTWDFALDGCGIHKELSIVGSGSGSFQNLLPCANYLVTETNANSNGFFSTPIGGQGVNLGPGGEETVTFSNVRNPDSTPPPPTVTTTVTPPTSTPTHTPTVSTTPTDPTDTPVDPTDTPTPESTVAGEKTPGPGNLATPIAPDSGTGIAAGAGGASVLLALLGLAVLTAGAGLMALGRKRA
ncbi:MAG: VWA domain-containing protein, partial [Dehalococcoidia bacterium]|nr:VWA domain-containing protein [Dehalococcoidia bacterium]